MRSKKATEGGDMIILSVVFMICILFGSIGIFAVKGLEDQKEQEQKTILYDALYSYHLSQYMLQPLDNPRSNEFESLLDDVLDKSGQRQNQQIALREKQKLSAFIDDFVSQYVTEYICWELHVAGRKIVENKDSCLLIRSMGIESVSLDIVSSYSDVEVIVR